ncbi:FtsX-like permease family protein [Tissierella sp.]|uniref:ABC transporter permease n=1 Tax=Tissierella sp. TaxID=41274 RepID=UPI0028639FCC|nr:FtsX-like permease family protein [Tissierella sp.]MDR7855183.1 FtsX-like permease family protein [Tissierella sp.]
MKLNKRVKRIFLEHKASYIGMILLIILSTSCFLGMKTATTSIEKSVDDNRIKANVEDANFSFSNTLTKDQIEKYEKDFNLLIQENRQIEYDYKGAVLRIRPEFKEINKAELYDGEYLKNSKDIMVDRFFYEAQNLSLGDKIAINGEEYTVCGIFTTPDYLSILKKKTDFMADGSKFGLCMVSEKTFNELAGGKESINYSIVFNQNSSDDFRKELAKEGIVLDWTGRDSNIRITTFDGEIDAIIILSSIAPLFILIVSSLIMAVVVGRMIKKEYTYIGTLSAMGYRKGEIVDHYLRLPIFISVIGSILGLVLGYFLVEPFTMLSSVEYNIPKTTYYYQWQDIVLMLTIPVILNIFAALIAIIQALHINIVALLKADAGKMKKGLLTKFIPNKKGSFKLRFKMKEITSNLPRSLLMLIGIIASSMFILTGFIFNSAIEFVFDNNFHEKFGYDYQYVLNTPMYESKTEGEPYMISSFDYDKKGESLSFTVYGVAENSKYIKLYNNGNLISQDKTVISKSVAKRLELKKGDVITVKNNSNFKEYRLAIDEICNISFGENVYMPLKELNAMLDLPESTYMGLYSDELLNIDEGLVSDILTLEDSKAGLESSIAAFKVFLYLLAFVSALVGTVVIYIVTIMLVEENRKNISMLKVVGYHNKEISSLLVNSTSALVWIGYFMAIPFAFFTIQKFFNILTTNMYFDFSVDLKLWQAIVSFAFILAIYYITLFFAKKKVLGINMAESLKVRE